MAGRSTLKSSENLSLDSDRLILRPLRATDADAITQHVNDWEVVRYTAMIPFPYHRQMAVDFIASQASLPLTGSFNLAIARKSDGQLMGCIGLIRSAEASDAELGYWLGRDFWHQGYATEAVRLITDFAFSQLGLQHVTASAVPTNTASHRVLEKNGLAVIGADEIQAPARGHPLQVILRRIRRIDWPPKPALNILTVVAVALIDADGRVLLAQRPEGKSLAGLWEFPGGKIDPGETPEAALIRELHEELDIDVKQSCLAPLTFASHSYEKFHLLMPLYVCRRWQGMVTAREGQKLAWVRPQQLKDYPMPPADEPLIPVLIDLL
ncbi:MAG: bifunctional GNAT family N-acetyltransferase/(deoxy)nucleoside triphosphate pyrophosphohydrolase [Dongiaceae bacterium]